MTITFKPPRPTVDMTFNMPTLPQLPPKHHSLVSIGDCAVQIARVAELQHRTVIVPIAEREWRGLNFLYRAWLALKGHTPISYYESRT